jgi:hypothetical protein
LDRNDRRERGEEERQRIERLEYKRKEECEKKERERINSEDGTLEDTRKGNNRARTTQETNTVKESFVEMSCRQREPEWCEKYAVRNRNGSRIQIGR